MARQSSTSPFGLAASLGAAAFYSGVAFWLRFPFLLTPGSKSKNDWTFSEKSAAVAGQTEAPRVVAAAVTRKKTPNAPTSIVTAASKSNLKSGKGNAKRLGKKAGPKTRRR
jgi:hypothetical protein